MHADYFNPGNGHYYAFDSSLSYVDHAGAMSWADSQVRCELAIRLSHSHGQTFQGVSGYLLDVSDVDEWNFLNSLGVYVSWLNAVFNFGNNRWFVRC